MWASKGQAAGALPATRLLTRLCGIPITKSIFSLQIKKKQKNTDPLSCPKVLSYVYTECLCCRLMEGKTEERRGEFPTENRLTLTFTVFPNSSLSFVGLSAPFAFSGGIMLLNE